MKRVRLITTDQHNGKEAISRTPLRNRYFFEGAWHEINVTVKPEILRDAQIIEMIEAIYDEMPKEFDIMKLIYIVERNSERCMHQATIQRQLCQLRQYGKLNYEVIDSSRGLYRKLPVVSKTCAKKIEMEFQPDWKKRFVEFLKEEGAYKDFMVCFNKRPNDSFDAFFTRNRSKNINNLIERAFNWPDTEIHRWDVLDEKWRAIYNGKN